MSTAASLTRSPRIPSVALAPEEVDFPIRVVRREGKPLHRPGLHSHQFFVIFFVESGSGGLELAEGALPVEPGTLHLLFPGEPHDASRLNDVRGWVIEFTGDVVGTGGPAGYFGEILGSSRWTRCLRKHGAKARCVTFEPEMRPLIAEHIRAISTELASKRAAHREVVRSRLQLLLVEIMRKLSPNALSRPLSPLVEEALAFIDTHHSDALSLSDVARAVGRSPAYLTDTVRTQTGLTVVEWIAERRMEDARRRLRETDEDVTIIAERLGYGSTNHFIRQFRKAHGTTPGAWRKI